MTTKNTMIILISTATIILISTATINHDNNKSIKSPPNHLAAGAQRSQH